MSETTVEIKNPCPVCGCELPSRNGKVGKLPQFHPICKEYALRRRQMEEALNSIESIMPENRGIIQGDLRALANMVQGSTRK